MESKSRDELEQARKLVAKINTLLNEEQVQTNVALGVLATLIVQASAMVSSSIGVERANKEFYSLITAMEKGYAMAMSVLDTEGETMQ